MRGCYPKSILSEDLFAVNELYLHMAAANTLFKQIAYPVLQQETQVVIV